MSQKTPLKPLAIAMGAAIATSLAATTAATAAENPFAMSDLSSGYMVAGGHEGKCGEGKCGEGKCGMSKMDANNDGKISKDEFMKGHQDKFDRKDKNNDGIIDAEEMNARKNTCDHNKGSEGKCGEGKCGGNKDKEGKCGEGKCGGNK